MIVPFPSMDADLEQVLSHYDSFNPSVPAATFLFTSTTVSTVVSTADLARTPLTTPFSPPSVASTASRRVYSSPKGNQAVNVAKACSIPVQNIVNQRCFSPDNLPPSHCYSGLWVVQLMIFARSLSH